MTVTAVVYALRGYEPYWLSVTAPLREDVIRLAFAIAFTSRPMTAAIRATGFY